MFAVINGQTSIVEEYFNNRNSKKDIYFHKVVTYKKTKQKIENRKQNLRNNLQVVRDTKQTLLFLLFLYCPSVSPKVVLKRKDLGKEVGRAED